MYMIVIITKQDEISLDSTWKPKIKLSDLTSEDCPCPHEYMDVSVMNLNLK